MVLFIVFSCFHLLYYTHVQSQGLSQDTSNNTNLIENMLSGYPQNYTQLQSQCNESPSNCPNLQLSNLFLGTEYSNSQVAFHCTTPPLECPNVNITFWLNTRSNKNDSYQLMANNSDSLKSAPWVKSGKVIFLIHGFTKNSTVFPIPELKDALLKVGDYNVISVNWADLCRLPCYLEGSRNTKLVGLCTAQLICQLMDYNEYNVTMEIINVIGFSLGGQVAGYTGKQITCGKLGTITALDPASPLFETLKIFHSVSQSDAEYVIVHHTSLLGMQNKTGHLDWFIKGVAQKECVGTTKPLFCDHNEAPKNFLKSINSTDDRCAIKCDSVTSCKSGLLLNYTNKVRYGYFAPNSTQGDYFVPTGLQSMYGC